MKSLLILRHAEAVPDTDDVPEAERPLTEFGELRSRALGLWLKERGYAPDRIECSAALRAVQTAELVVRAAAWTAPVVPFKHLYLASADALLAQAQAQADEVDQLVLVAHAPGVPNLASALVTKHADAALACEPATLAEVVFDVDRWTGIERGSGALRLLLPGAP